jgi:hypothetical protein
MNCTIRLLVALVTVLPLACSEPAPGNEEGEESGSPDTGSDASGTDDAATEGGAPDISQLGDALLEAVDDGFLAGGILGRYLVLPPPPEEEGGDEEEAPAALDLAVRRLDSGIDFPALDSQFANFGDYFEVEWRGGMFVEESGVHHFRLTVADSARVRLGELVLFDEWATGTYTTAEVTVPLEAGWHPLEIDYARNSSDALIVLSSMPPGAANPAVIVGDAMGYVDEPPKSEAPLALLAMSVEDVWPYGARITAETSAPAVLTISWTATDGSTDLYSEGSVPSSAIPVNEHKVLLDLAPDREYDVSVKVKDLWGRQIAADKFPIMTPEKGSWLSGGILGTYFEGTEFALPLHYRIDPRINLPQDADGGLNGSFALPMPANNFSIRWQGAIFIPTNDTYTLYVGGDNGARLSLDGALIIDAWEAGGFTHEHVIELTKGWHPMTFEMWEQGGNALATLEWSTATLPRSIVPALNLGATLPEDDGESPEIVDFVAYGGGEEMAGFEWSATELTSALLFYTITNDLGGIIQPETQVNFNLVATGGKWWIEEIPGGYLEATLVVMDRFGNVSTGASAETYVTPRMEDN